MIRKRNVLLLASLLLSLLTVYFGGYRFSGKTAAQLQPVHTPELAVTEMRGRDSRAFSDGVASLDLCGRLTWSGASGNETIANGAVAAIPVRNGIAYRDRSDQLFYAHDGTCEKIDEHVAQIGQFASELVYVTEDHAVCLWNGAERAVLVQLDAQDRVSALFGNSQYLILVGDPLYIYQKESGLRKTEWRCTDASAAFLYGDDLVLIGFNSAGGEVYHIPTQTVQPLRLGFPTGEKANENTISVAADAHTVYLSVRSEECRAWPFYGENTYTGTFRLDPADWSVERLDEAYRSGLILGKDGLYAFDSRKHRGTRICSAEIAEKIIE